jgi:two-component system, sensor histidine kinase and response regulator
MEPTKILIVEDEILTAREIEIALQELGYIISGIASDGQTAFKKVAEVQPDLILMDIVMPGDLDGIETADQIHAHFQVPIVFLTAYADAQTLERAKITEPFGYLLKPFQAHELNIAIQVALTRHRAEQERLKTLRNNISASLPQKITTPLQTILKFTDIVIHYYDLMVKAELLETVQYIQSAAIGLEKICRDFLLYTQLELIGADPSKLRQLQQVETAYTLALIENWATQKAKEFNRVVDLRLNLQELAVQISESYLKRIVEELLDNAFRFSESITSVEVKSYSCDRHFCLSISDQGRGMTPTQVAQIGAYIHLDQDIFEQQGLGLALVQQLVKLHNGFFMIESSLGEGTTVLVQLPIPNFTSR